VQFVVFLKELCHWSDFYKRVDVAKLDLAVKEACQQTRKFDRNHDTNTTN